MNTFKKRAQEQNIMMDKGLRAQQIYQIAVIRVDIPPTGLADSGVEWSEVELQFEATYHSLIPIREDARKRRTKNGGPAT